jgi:hypothetical protein
LLQAASNPSNSSDKLIRLNIVGIIGFISRRWGQE